MNVQQATGIGLPTELPLADGELARILALGVAHYLAYVHVDQLDAWHPILAAIKTQQPDALIHVRIETRGDLDVPADHAAITAAHHALGDLVADHRVRNEPNVESPGVTPAAWFAYLAALGPAVRFADPTIRLYVPATSPSGPLAGAFLAESAAGAVAGQFAGLDAHLYGNPAAILAGVDRVRALYRGPLLLSECNFGAGNRVDLGEYAAGLPTIFAGLAQRGVPGCVFVARWVHPPIGLPTTVDILGTPAEQAIKELTKVEPTNAPTYHVGPGVAAKIKEQGDEPTSDEQYLGSEMSFTTGHKGLYVYSKGANDTTFIAAA